MGVETEIIRPLPGQNVTVHYTRFGSYKLKICQIIREGKSNHCRTRVFKVVRELCFDSLAARQL